MPRLNGTGPQGNGAMDGRGFGRCRMAPVHAKEPAALAQPVQNDKRAEMSQDTVQNIPVYCRGRGGIPCGCGRGFGSGGAGYLRG